MHSNRVIEGPLGRATPPPFLIYDRHTSEGDRQNVHAFQARPMEGDSGNRLDGFGVWLNLRYSDWRMYSILQNQKECESCIFRPCRKQSDVSSLLSVDESRKVSKMRCGRCLCSIIAIGPDCALSDRFNSSTWLCLCHPNQKPATSNKRKCYLGAGHVRGKDEHIRTETVLEFILITSHDRICKP